MFLSYAHGHDDAYVQRLAEFLQGSGLAVWYDREVVSGHDWARVIKSQLETSAAVVVVMSPDSEASTWVRRELNYAEQLDRPTFPLLIRGGCFFELSHLQYEDVTGGGLPSAVFVKELHRVTGTPMRPAVSPEPPVVAVAPEKGVVPAAEKAGWRAEISHRGFKWLPGNVVQAKIKLTRETHVVVVRENLTEAVVELDGVAVPNSDQWSADFTLSDGDSRYAARIEYANVLNRKQILTIVVGGQVLPMSAA